MTPAPICTRCAAPVRDRAFELCGMCADAELFGDIDTIAPDPFFEARTAWIEGVWLRICNTVGGLW